MVGDLVMLSTHDLHMHNNCKFAAHFIEPFQVLNCIGKFAYHINLPLIYSTLHNAFHMPKLKLYIPNGGDGTSTNVQPVLVDDDEQYEVEKIVAEYGHGNCKHYLVCWVGYLAKHYLWLPESELAQAPDVLVAWKWQLGD